MTGSSEISKRNFGKRWKKQTLHPLWPRRVEGKRSVQALAHTGLEREAVH